MSVSYSQPCLISRTRESNATTRTACSSTPERSTRIYAVTHEFVPVFYRELEQVREREFLVGSSSKCALVVVGHFLCVYCEIPIRPAAHAKPQTVVAHEPLTCDGRRLRYQHPSSSSTPCTAPLQTRRLQTSGSHAHHAAIHSALLHRIFGDDSAAQMSTCRALGQRAHFFSFHLKLELKVVKLQCHMDLVLKRIILVPYPLPVIQSAARARSEGIDKPEYCMRNTPLGVCRP